MPDTMALTYALGEAPSMSSQLSDQGIGTLPVSGLAHKLSRLRDRAAALRLDEELAEGADPWGSAAHMQRAQRLCSPRVRRRLATQLRELVRLGDNGSFGRHLFVMVRLQSCGSNA